MFIRSISLKENAYQDKIMQSFLETGFAVLTDHSIDLTLIESCYQDWMAFFASDAKRDFLFDEANQDGFFPIKSEAAKGASLADLKEFYHYYAKFRKPLGCQANTEKMFTCMLDLGQSLLNILDEALPQNIQAQLSESLSSMAKDSPQTFIRPIHYPAIAEEDFVGGAVRAAAHEDINLITLLPAASSPGLEVLDKQGQWHEVSCDPGMIVVNIGDMLQEATDFYLPSTKHRVVNPVSQDCNVPRYSLPMFVHARPEVVVSKRYTAKEYLLERLKEIGLKK